MNDAKKQHLLSEEGARDPARREGCLVGQSNSQSVRLSCTGMRAQTGQGGALPLMGVKGLAKRQFKSPEYERKFFVFLPAAVAENAILASHSQNLESVFMPSPVKSAVTKSVL